MTAAFPTRSKQRGSARTVLVFVVLLVFTTGLLFSISLARRTAAEHIKLASKAYQSKKYSDALSQAESALRLEPHNSEALLIAGQAVSGLKQYQKALEYFSQVPEDAGTLTKTAKLEAAELQFTNFKQASAAAELYRSVLKLDEEDTLAVYRLAYLLGIGGRNWEAVPFRLQLLRMNQVNPIDLYLLCDGDSLLQNVETLAEFYQAAPEDPLILVGMARQSLDKQDFSKAESLLRQCIQLRPDDLEAQVKLGELLLDQKREADFVAWHSSVSDQIYTHPGYWKLVGNWSRMHDMPQEAIRCFWEGLKIDPAQVQLSYQLSQLLPSEEFKVEAERFLAHSKLLERYYTAVSSAWTGEDLGSVRQSAELADELGMKWEAWGWVSLMHMHHPGAAWSQRMRARIGSELSGLKLDRIIASANPALTVDLSNFPMPQLEIHKSNPPLPSFAESSKSGAKIHFQDQASELGIDMTFYNGAPRDRQTRRMYEFNGGGVAVLDFDQDGWSDLLFTQGNEGPQTNPSDVWSDRLYRNLDGGHFIDVAAESGAADSAFSSGVAVGDFNNDGFPDIYVSNLHANRFLMNNGDGTFEDVTEETGTAGDDWSSSCMFADLNGDGLADLYVVNYLSGDDIFTRVCSGEQQQIRSCSPRQFPGAQDRLYVNNGDGSYDDLTETSGIKLEAGKGLGIVAMSGSQAGMLNLFVANDAVPNFYLVNTAKPGDRPQFQDQALVSGLAINEQGLSEACMGVAAGDADNDGLIDLFVTNFYNESNTFYQQTSTGLFEDSTRRNQLHAPGLKLLGFGTQFVDADLNGDLDLIVVNGHIDDLSDEGIPCEMPAQFFVNAGESKFTEVPAETLGGYFQKKLLGRGVARLDWNRDGRNDVTVSHLDAPVALLTNTTEVTGHYLSLQLRGTVSSRDAIGSVVTVSAGGRRLVHELTAGDGFQASNEKRILIGLGRVDAVDELTIQWPSGTSHTFNDIPVDTELLLIESRPSMLELPIR